MRRIYRELLFELLELFPCVALFGPRQCGKTTLLQELPPSWRRFDLEKASDLALVARDPDLFLRLHPNLIAIDEAQLHPPLFNALRVAIDQDRGRSGRFVITGSSSPTLVRAVSESLAGRVGIIEMAPFTYAETREHFESPFFRALEERVDLGTLIDTLGPTGTLADVHDYWLRGGYPDPWVRRNARFQSLWMENYVRTYLERDLARLFPGIDDLRFRTFLGLLANLSGTVINYSEVARALSVSQPTARDYFEIASGTCLWRTVPAFTRNAPKRIVKHPRGHLRDSGLRHHLLRIVALDDLQVHPTMGASWEAMVIEELLRGLLARGIAFDHAYYRTAAGAEVDLVLDGAFGLLPIEIKYTQTVRPRDLVALGAFVREYGCRYGLVINNAEAPCRYDERLLGIPFTHL